MTAEHQLFNFILILARVSAFVAFLPIFAQRQLPHLVKAGLAMSLTVFWFGALPQELFYVNQIDIVTSTLFLAKEITIGLLLAMLLGFMFVQAKIAGAYIGQEVGLSLASVTSPGTSDSSTLVTTIFETFAVLLFFGLNLHHFLVRIVHYSLINIGGKIEITDLPTELLTQMAGSLTTHGSMIAAPIGVSLFILTIAISLLNKAAPTLNLFSVGMTLRSGIGILCLIVFFPIIIKSMETHFRIYLFQLEQFFSYYQ
ncbi:MAG: flagellar biosynthetic protein FliR [Mariniblastus sp.]|nr:flagellar biosynthetic protein FliR [Mariniblastus sp.]